MENFSGAAAESSKKSGSTDIDVGKKGRLAPALSSSE
jgi:hypothetical protein